MLGATLSMLAAIVLSHYYLEWDLQKIVGQMTQAQKRHPGYVWI